MIPIYKPYLTKESLTYAHDAIDSTWISSRGKYINLVKEKLQDLLNVKYIIPVNNGTSATHLLAKSLLFKSKVNTIIVPNNVYIAAINSFLFDNKFKLKPIDADLNSWNFDLNELQNKIKKYPKSHILIVHNIGNIINVPKLKEKYPNNLFVEDNCEGFLGKYESYFSGTASFASSVSFFGNKTITSGEGGAFITNDENVYNFANCLHGQGQSEVKFIHSNLGYNYRMTNIQAAILYGQLEILQEIISKKNEIFFKYKENFKNVNNLFLQKNEDNTTHSNWMFGIRIINSNYDNAIKFFTNKGIEIRPMFYPLNDHCFLKDYINFKNVKFDNAMILNKESFILPSYPNMSAEEQEYIIKSTIDYIKEFNLDK